MIEHTFVEERCKTEDKDLIHVRFMTEEQLLASDIFGGPMCFARARYDYLKHSNEGIYKWLMRYGYMYEECRRAKHFIRQKFHDISEGYVLKNPNNYNAKMYTENLKLNIEADTYAREIVNADYVCSNNLYYYMRDLDFDEE